MAVDTDESTPYCKRACRAPRRVPQRLIAMFEGRTLVAWLDYRPADYEEACLREWNWLALLQMQERRRACPHGIEAHVLIVMLYDRVRHLRN